MSSKLKRLIDTYAFLADCRNAEEYRAFPDHARDIERRTAVLVREIVALEPADPAETCAQARVVVAALSATEPESAIAAYLKKICDSHLTRFEVQVTESAPASRESLLPNDWSAFDLLTERVGVLDRDYRYLFTNASNAEFHRTEAKAFVGVPNYQVVGDNHFRIHKSRFDACLAGQRLTTYSSHPFTDRDRVFSNTFSPAYDAEGRVIAAIVTCREVPREAVPAHLLLPAPAE